VLVHAICATIARLIEDGTGKVPALAAASGENMRDLYDIVDIAADAGAVSVADLEPVASAIAPAVDRLAEFLEHHRRVLVLTGAGLSTGSGIPDYRDRDGVRRGKAPVQGPEFRRDEAVRKRYWARSMVGYPVLSRTRPNAGHRAIAELQRAGKLAAVITQNVDGLHQRAGSDDSTGSLIELHGNIHRVVCLACEATFTRDFVQAQLEQANPGMASTQAAPLPDGDAHLEPESLADFQVPTCLHCGGMLKPDVVFFGDGVPRHCSEGSQRLVDETDALLVIGSSVMVFSSFRLCRSAAQAGKPVVALNLGKTRADDLLAFKLEHTAEHLLPLLARKLVPGDPLPS
jgi:NAD-dependent SIR2 family protein deacetylase